MLSLAIHRLTGAALMVGSLLFIVNKVDDMGRVYLNQSLPDLITGESLLALAIGQVALALGVVGCYLVYAKRTNLLGKLGLILLAVGGVLLALGHISFTSFVPEDSPTFLLVIFGVLLMVLGLTLFGLVNLRSKALQSWQLLPLITGLLGFAAFVLFGNDQNPAVFLAMRTLFGVGLALLAIVMWQDARDATSTNLHTAQHAG
jgi:hypothetical protein